MNRDILLILGCIMFLAVGPAAATIHDRLDEFTDERSLFVLLRGVVMHSAEDETPFFSLKCDFNMKRIHAIVTVPREFYFQYDDLRENAPINVDLRFDRKRMLEERWNWGRLGTSMAINWMAVHLLPEALAADRLIVRVGGEGNQTLSFDLAANRTDLLEFKRRCAWVK